jgi:hypothetical protein
MALRRFWFPVEGHLGIGVSAPTLDEATALAEQFRRANWASASLGIPINDVDIRELDQKHVIPNIGPVAVPGLWFPRGNL